MGIVYFIFLLIIIDIYEKTAPFLLCEGSKALSGFSFLKGMTALSLQKATEITEIIFQIASVGAILVFLLWFFGIFDLIKKKEK